MLCTAMDYGKIEAGHDDAFNIGTALTLRTTEMARMAENKYKRIQVEVGQRFGRLTVSGLGPRKRVGKREGFTVLTWDCVCDCGGHKNLIQGSLLSGKTKSCGCLRSELTAERGHARTRHGKYGSPAYSSWSSMRSRCNNPNDPSYGHYGGRGITVCDRWKEFAAFLADMGERPSLSHSIDRWPNNNAGYEPGNCRWATHLEQSNNTRRNHNIEFRGERKSMSEWARIVGIDRSVLRRRIADGWLPDVALTLPAKPNNNDRKMEAARHANRL